ncbi:MULTISPECIES: sulfate reduction electron transfer complex DsrMKJOP subunit DsrO [Prosthecochloris]|uniref:4Fe-4S dicluster domain-containing protein n=1 Tax=Prosthecochloris vibrioformis TaxID=1098 RepID=A0A5C4S364_PROVB|nr:MULTISPECIES: 4Fe-4S dicluster domain-containing protein [Prosthecochloris]ANT63862.1 Tetrathionate reductase electron transport protein [Prosthecochloris sp. CIB 2401]TNJ37618.1 4Fe-4S dicluster domain-containing protein [Prosthecochloris vibrioformis]
MNQQRREFLRKAGFAALAGLGAAAGLNPLHALEKTDTSVFPRKPVEGKVRWGMLIDTRNCPEGCTKCSAACHFEHNVPDFSGTKNEVKWIWKSPYEKAFPTSGMQFKSDELEKLEVPTLCNHCAEPPCAKACPTEATFKRWDGIVSMDYHRCIGCRFCMAACPYGSRSFNWQDPRPGIEIFSASYPTRERGVVEKCNFCSERLVKGMLPACVEACPGKAITFGNLNDPASDIRALLAREETMQRKPELGTLPSVFYII